MKDISLKYNLLSKNNQKTVDDFIAFLLNKETAQKCNENYRTKILSVSTWTDSDLNFFKTIKSLLQKVKN